MPNSELKKVKNFYTYFVYKIMVFKGLLRVATDHKKTDLFIDMVCESRPSDQFKACLR